MNQGISFSSSNTLPLKILPQRNLNTVSQERTIFCVAFQTLALPVHVTFLSLDARGGCLCLGRLCLTAYSHPNPESFLETTLKSLPGSLHW